MFPFRTKPPARTAVGWEHLVIRPDTKLTAADKRRVEKAIRRAKKEGKIAKTAQQTIPYEEMYPDGICRITNRLYSKSVLCDDINYAEASDDEKAVLFELYCKLVNYFGPSVGFELSVICYPADLVEYRKMLPLRLGRFFSKHQLRLQRICLLRLHAQRRPQPAPHHRPGHL